MGRDPRARWGRQAPSLGPMRPPVIGICTSLEPVRFGLWHAVAAFSPFSYVQAVQRAGGMALLLAPDEQVTREPDLMLDLVDGLVLAGGVDVDPATYGQEPHPETKGYVPERDAFELALAARALERDLPLLGICRGMQVLNVARGGTLVQHLPDVVAHEDHRRNAGTFEGNDHDVELVPGSLAERAAGELLHPTKSHHHQAIDRLGEGLVVTGRATQDDLVEAVEVPGARWVLGVQWHPEADEASRVIGALVDEARARDRRAGLSGLRPRPGAPRAPGARGRPAPWRPRRRRRARARCPRGCGPRAPGRPGRCAGAAGARRGSGRGPGAPPG